MAQALRPQYLLNGRLTYQQPAAGGMESLDDSLDILRVSAYAIRAQLLRAIVLCIRDDGRLSAEEAELLRMLALSLDCPLPPLDSVSFHEEPTGQR